MFYAEAILSKKGPLAKVWLAAHLERKLTKAQLLQTSIPSSVGAIIGQDQGPPLALRLSGQLLLGVARIYARKARYLLEDCSEALVRIKMAFRPGAADITSDAVVAAHNAITLPEALTEFDILLPSPVHLLGADGAAGIGADGLAAGAASNTSRPQDITLAEQHFDISAVARGGELGDSMGLGEEDLLGRDDEFRLDLDDDFALPSPQPGPAMDLDASALEPEVGRDAAAGLAESMVGIRAEDVSLAAKPAGNEGSMMDITHEDLALNAAGGGDGLRFGDGSGMAVSGGPGASSMAVGTQEAALQAAEAEVLAAGASAGAGAGAGASRPGKRRRLNLADLVSSEATSLSPDEIRGRLNDPADIVRVPTYLPATRVARLEDASSAAIAAQFLALDAAAQFSSLLGPARATPEQRVPEESLYPSIYEPLVPGHGLDDDEFRIDDAGDELALGEDPDASAQQLEAEALLGNKSVEQLERLEEESFQRQADERQQGGVRLFADAAADPGEDARPLGSSEEGAAEGDAAAVGHSKSTIQAVRILDAASQAKGIQASDAAAAAASGADEALSFADITKDARRDDAVKLFFELLVLKTKDFVDVAQPAPYEDIAIVPRSTLGRLAAAAADYCFL
ncbi:sister chromatid cohesion protein 1 [Coemansia javaensis]|uniref:Sister chromatid cohesion protein 1 n=1 Tax=Coemansia javaensis TaxID=2761396 RepID=A0A9W8LE86_9FUNG|nr:sister chromatid cohesion protein 1 [Coemansia javaensis]